MKTKTFSRDFEKSKRKIFGIRHIGGHLSLDRAEC